ncbi:MAG TPA: FtsX-like permease family protein, partial [Candidatus Sulfotelmatobacter sp.]|nr:FtsX-like permease family protein [Candidatus Sulfotelmatobacter sp.]
AFKNAAEKVASGNLFYFSLADQEASVESSIHLQAIAFGLFASLAGTVCLIVIAQAVARQVLAATGELPLLRALGASPRQLWLAAMVPAVAASLTAAALGAILAILLSPLTPLGLARVAEPSPGLSLDVTVLLAGAAFLVLITALLAAYPAWRATRYAEAARSRDRAEPRMSAVAEGLGRAGLPASAAAGIRLALTPGNGRLRVPVLAGLAGCIVGVAAASAALTFRASLDHLLTTPRLFGWAWDAEVSPNSGGPSGGIPVPSGPQIRYVGRGTGRELAIDGERVNAYGIDAVRGAVPPVIIEGRAPQAADEIMLGTRTDAAKRLGDSVSAGAGGTSRPMTLVGRGLFPPQDENGQLGVGAFMTFAGMKRIVGDAAGPGLDIFPVVFTPGTNLAMETRALEAAYGGPGTVELPAPPTDLINFGSVDQLPGVLALVLVVAGVATLAHTLVTAVRRRRRDLAILKTLGFTRGQIASTVAWQSLTLIAIAVLVGLPAGIAAGRWAWSLFASAQGTIAEPLVPLALVLLTIPAAVVLAELVALLPGRLAARTRPALVLRTE